MGQINILSTDGTHKAGLSFTGTSDISVDTGNIASKTEVDSKPTGFKNYIINGGFDVSQRGNYTTSTFLNGEGYFVDRWKYVNSSIFNYQHTSVILPNNKSVRAIKIIANSSATGYGQIRQLVENFESIKGQTITLSAYVRSNKTVSSGLMLSWYSGDVTWQEGQGQIICDGNWHLIKFTGVFSQNATRCEIGVINNNQWISGEFIEIAQVQLEEGSVATPFENRPYGLELSLCQRYYYSEDWAPYNIGFVFNTTQLAVNVIKLPVAMRVVPTITSIKAYHISTQGNWGIYGATNGWSTGYAPSFSPITNQYIAPQFSGVSGVTNGASYICNGWFSASAEL
jgi:hypothetical protein